MNYVELGFPHRHRNMRFGKTNYCCVDEVGPERLIVEVDDYRSFGCQNLVGYVVRSADRKKGQGQGHEFSFRREGMHA